ncbi:hypothetical protein [Deinococcus ruber]|uniref:hypothetical protein n=1 Tax=Deinococcus ruber TaxID=1848197 RepID=UPI00166E5A6E|nr:hypothetical protein [Deinococcus ruber]
MMKSTGDLPEDCRLSVPNEDALVTPPVRMPTGARLPLTLFLASPRDQRTVSLLSEVNHHFAA